MPQVFRVRASLLRIGGRLQLETLARFQQYRLQRLQGLRRTANREDSGRVCGSGKQLKFRYACDPGGGDHFAMLESVKILSGAEPLRCSSATGGKLAGCETRSEYRGEVLVVP